jgi:glyoxylase-like metal-dependent hydrolase (beta-lactamase superfamily II)
MLVETRRQSPPSILIGADEALLRRFMPGGTYLAATNAFLIRHRATGKSNPDLRATSSSGSERNIAAPPGKSSLDSRATSFASQNIVPDRIVLVDTGFGGAIFDHLRALGVSPDAVDAVLLTHLHGDHTGGLQHGGAARFPNATVYLAEQERDYWTRVNVNPGAVAALAPYAGRMHTFQPGTLGSGAEELLPGITPIAAFGHTPGHTAYLLESRGSEFLIWGDLIHVEDIQFPAPDISVTYDTDPLAAAAVRKQFLAYVAEHRIPVGGMHLAYPAIGTVTAEGEGYRFVRAK